jgi:hypothetical protein
VIRYATAQVIAQFALAQAGFSVLGYPLIPRESLEHSLYQIPRPGIRAQDRPRTPKIGRNRRFSARPFVTSIRPSPLPHNASNRPLSRNCGRAVPENGNLRVAVDSLFSRTGNPLQYLCRSGKAALNRTRSTKPGRGRRCQNRPQNPRDQPT